MEQVANLQIKVTSGDVNTASQNLDRMAVSADKAEKAAKRTSDAFGGQFRSNMQNASYQFQDIAIQAQMGTSALTILGQQGPQLLSIFGPGGAVVGALVAVGAAALSMGAGADSATESLKLLHEAGNRLADLRLTTLVQDMEASSKAGFKNLEMYKQLGDEARNAETKVENLAAQLEVARGNLQTSVDRQGKISLNPFEDDVGSVADNARAVNELTQALAEAQVARNKIVEQREAIAEVYVTEQRAADKASVATERASERAIKAAERKFEALDRQADAWLQKTEYYGQSQLDRITTWQDHELSQLKEFMDAKVLTATEGQLAYERIMDESLKRQVDAQASAEAEKKRLADEAVRAQQQTASMWLDMTNTMLTATTDMMEQSGQENSGFMKALFAMQKALAIPSILASTETAAAAALAHETMLGGLISGQTAANLIRVQGYATAGMVGGMAIAGAFDSGGIIPAGQMGIVGEFGPEFVKGPAVITSRAKTAEMARSGMSGGSGGGTVVNVVQNINVTGNGDQALARAMEQAAKKGTNDALAQVRNDANTNGPIRRTYGV